jgi:hydrogenase nickel incorporation protein HypB
VSVEIGRAEHLDAAMLEQALVALPPETTGQVLVERIGNLTRAPHPLGEQAKVLVVAVGVSQHLPRKYEEIFAWADAVVLNMTDLIPLTDFRLADFEKILHATNPHAELIPLSCRTGEGVDNWLRWLAGKAPV